MAIVDFVIQPPVIAHRGASAYAPENTLAAFLKAKELGIQWVEFDVMLTKEGEVVVIHDETLDRTTNCQGRVCDFSFDYISTLDAGSWFNKSFAQEKILSFKQLIDFLAEHHLAANVEIKAQQGQEEKTVKNVLKNLADHWQPFMLPPLVSSFSLDILRFVRRYSATCWLGLLMDEWHEDWERICDELSCISVNVNHQILTPQRAQQILATQRKILCYTVDDPARAHELFSWGVHAVFSNMPDRIVNNQLHH